MMLSVEYENKENKVVKMAGPREDSAPMRRRRGRRSGIDMLVLIPSNQMSSALADE